MNLYWSRLYYRPFGSLPAMRLYCLPLVLLLLAFLLPEPLCAQQDRPAAVAQSEETQTQKTQTQKTQTQKTQTQKTQTQKTQTQEAQGLLIYPDNFTLRGTAARQQLVVAERKDGRLTDLTGSVPLRSLTPEVAAVDPHGVVRPLSDGTARFAARSGDREVVATATVAGCRVSPPLSFELDIMPILTAAGCNAGACHGKARGQNGFQLSLLGFDADFDYDALTKNARGRRIFPAAPERSLLLQKACGLVPHGGGRRLDPDGPRYETLRRWLAEGARRYVANEPEIERITAWPKRRFMKPGEQQQLVVRAYYSDGTQRDVTAETAYHSSEDTLVPVADSGVVTAGEIPGEASIMVRYLGKIDTARVSIPLPGRVDPAVFAGLPRNNFIDEHIWQKLQSLGIEPAEPVGDAKFMRRVYLDIIGRVPTPHEVRAFLADTSPDKRARLVDRLLERPEYADHWATKWNDLLLPNPYRVGIKTVLNYDAWIRRQFRENVPYDEFVTRLVTARGSTFENGAVTLYRDRRTPDEVTTLVSQLFLGIRLECAKCHQHPFEKWGQHHFYSLASYFARVGHVGRISPPISGSEEKIFTAPDDGRRYVVKHPVSGEILEPQPLFGDAPEIGEEEDPRRSLAQWMISEQNEYFAQVMTNRVWADLMGRGIVEPVDDFRATNPPTNEPLLRALAEHFRQEDFNIKKLIRTICLSHAYALSSDTNPRNMADTRNYSRHYRQRLRAEVLLDAVCDITGVPETFAAMPPGSRATQLWTRRVGSVFLDTFGRPDRNQDPPCERSGETAVTQALHLMNSPALHQKVTADAGRAAQLAASDHANEEIVQELYLLIYNRPPTADESSFGTRLFAAVGITRRRATAGMMWALLNTPEFVFKD